ncbi:ATP-binding protein [Actinomadura sp. ATCC 31491]|uniref:ATP-binding protein n=1 Tax=Actinomadura luzonensis TaxID=2805427 RepID=A0ABT0G9R1_9ACTN|nr:ATP-binding protein [Actinomadura luzonensis]MCK2220965.1 ATP-binding protein [Actinomadura luzonensis]
MAAEPREEWRAGQGRTGMAEQAPLRWPITPELGKLRERVQAYALAAGFTGARLRDVVLVVNEAADNVLEHGGGSGVVVAHADGDGLWIEVCDPAGTLTDERFRRLTAVPPPLARHGYGLWVIARLCDEVHIDHPGGGSRLRLRLNRRHPTLHGNAVPREDEHPGEP